MFIRASQNSHLLIMVTLEYIFSWGNVLNKQCLEIDETNMCCAVKPVLERCMLLSNSL